MSFFIATTILIISGIFSDVIASWISPKGVKKRMIVVGLFLLSSYGGGYFIYKTELLDQEKALEAQKSEFKNLIREERTKSNSPRDSGDITQKHIDTSFSSDNKDKSQHRSTKRENKTFVENQPIGVKVLGWIIIAFNLAFALLPYRMFRLFVKYKKANDLTASRYFLCIFVFIFFFIIVTKITVRSSNFFTPSLFVVEKGKEVSNTIKNKYNSACKSLKNILDPLFY